MILRQKMIKLNRIRIAYSEEDIKRLAADGYELVPDGEKTGKEASGKDVVSLDGKPGKKRKAAGGENKDA